MDSSKIIEILIKKNGIIDQEAITSVGMLCKRAEVLDANKSLSPNLYKDLAKEIIYEQSRVLKKRLWAILIPSVTFVSKKSKEK